MHWLKDTTGAMNEAVEEMWDGYRLDENHDESEAPFSKQELRDALKYVRDNFEEYDI